MSIPEDTPVARRRARVVRIRKTVAAIATAVFLALFATIYVQMAAGKDPALGASAVVAGQSSGAGATSAAEQSSSASDATSAGAAESDGQAGDAGPSQTTDQPASVTTSQS